MIMDSSFINQKFIVKSINASEEELHTLKTIGIDRGTELIVIGNGYVEGSILVICNNVLIQLNPYFIKKIRGTFVKEKRNSK